MNFWIFGFMNFGAGFITGIIYNWNKKIMIGIWIALIILLYVLYLTTNPSPSVYTFKHFIIQFPCMLFGDLAGCWHWKELKKDE